MMNQKIKLKCIDYYLIMPAKYINIPLQIDSIENRKELLKPIVKPPNPRIRETVVDIKNGYLSIWEHKHEWGSYFSMALFKTETNMDIIGISSETYDGDDSQYNLYFLKFENNEWWEINNQVLPKLNYSLFLKKYEANEANKLNYLLENTVFECYLPRYGTTAYLDFISMYPKIKFKDEDYEWLRKLTLNASFQYLELQWDKKVARLRLDRN